MSQIKKHHKNAALIREVVSKYFNFSIYELQYFGNFIGMRCTFPGGIVNGHRLSLEAYCPTPAPLNEHIKLMFRRMYSAPEMDEEKFYTEIRYAYFRNPEDTRSVLLALRDDKISKNVIAEIYGNPLAITSAYVYATAQYIQDLYVDDSSMKQVYLFVNCAATSLPNNSAIKIHTLGYNSYLILFQRGVIINPATAGVSLSSEYSDALDNSAVNSTSNVYLTLVLRDEDRCARGFIRVNAVNHISNAASVTKFIVDPEWQGKHLGKRLFACAEQIMRRLQLYSVMLDSFAYQAPKFYMKMGYTETAIVPWGGFILHFFNRQLPSLEKRVEATPKLLC
jgi:GNAT superfamily N-acetyltransferase/mRNA-degrading endonuclease HigB of HigAB toxin-antitoxin module